MRIKNNDRGITLIALIITIVVIVIFVAVSIRAVTNTKIVEHAANGVQDYTQKAKNENAMLDASGRRINDAVAKIKEIQGGNAGNTQNFSEDFGFYITNSNTFIPWDDLVKIGTLGTDPRYVDSSEIEALNLSIDIANTPYSYVLVENDENETILKEFYSAESGILFISDEITKIENKDSSSGSYYQVFDVDGVSNENPIDIVIPNSVKIIGSNSFSYCEIENLSIPNSVKYIGPNAFYNCTSLTSLSVPNSVKTVGNSFVNGCSSLSSLSLGSGVTRIVYETYDYPDGYIIKTAEYPIIDIYTLSSLSSLQINGNAPFLGYYYSRFGALDRDFFVRDWDIDENILTITDGKFYGIFITGITSDYSNFKRVYSWNDLLELGKYSYSEITEEELIENIACDVYNEYNYISGYPYIYIDNEDALNSECYIEGAFYATEGVSFDIDYWIFSMPSEARLSGNIFLGNHEDKLTYITLPDAFTSIPYNLNGSGIYSLTLLASIGWETPSFNQCDSLGSLIIPSSWPQLSDYDNGDGTYDWETLTEDIGISDKLVYVEIQNHGNKVSSYVSGLTDCEELSELTIPAGFPYIPDLSACSSLQDLHISPYSQFLSDYKNEYGNIDYDAAIEAMGLPDTISIWEIT